MCGLFGWSFTERTPRNWAIAAASLSANNDGRGGHAWGIYVPESDTVLKNTGKISDYIDAITMSSFREILCHTRYKTHGANTPENAHPFRVGSIVGMHNGMLQNHDQLNRFYPDRKYKVDSLHLLHALAYGTPQNEVVGYGTVVYSKVDYSREWEKSDKIYLAPFNGGELSIAGIYDHRAKSDSEYLGIVWSSEEDHLYTALHSMRLEYEVDYVFFELKDSRMYYIQNGKLFESPTVLRIRPPKANKFTEIQYSSRVQEDEVEDLIIEASLGNAEEGEVEIGL